MSFRNHYDTLGLSKTVTQEEIKAAFRRLSMATHPDVAKDADGEAFKAIAEANSILSNPNERLKYDRQLQEASMWRRVGGRAPGSGGDFYGGDNLRRPGARKPPMHAVMETLSNPRYVILGAVAFGSIFMLSAMLGGVTSKQRDYHHHSNMVEAWKNPNTGRWEQPAPWDPLYRQLKPKLELIPRERVQRRHM
jgi:curved DNA-binding protein CbpA